MENAKQELDGVGTGFFAAIGARSAVIGALVLLIPLLVFNPDLARRALEWFELVVGSLLAALTAGIVGAGLGRLLKRDAATWSRHVVHVWLALALALVGWIIAGFGGVFLALLCFVVIAVVAKIRADSQILRLEPGLAATVIAALVLSATAFFLARPGAADGRQLIMIGLDGATWKIIDEHRAAGEFPTFDRLIKEGTRVDLDTLFPIISPPIWTSIATGKTPANHGIQDFWVSSRDVQAKRIWEIADDTGMESGVLGYLVTWPPLKENGFMVPGWLAQDASTVPEDLSFLKQIELGEKQGQSRTLADTLRLSFAGLRHGVTLTTLNTAAGLVLDRRRGLDERDWAYRARQLKFAFAEDVFCYLLRRQQPRLSIFYDSTIDATQHLFFKYYDPEGFTNLTEEEIARFGDVVPAVYRQADAAIARILSIARSDANVVVVSDHGQQAAMADGGEWHAVRSTKLLEVLGLTDQVRATNAGDSAFIRPISDDVDLSVAADVIRSVVTVADGEPLFVVDQRDPTIANLAVRRDLDSSVEHMVRAGDRELPASELVQEAGSMSGVHTETAMLLLQGPDIQEDKALAERGSVLDVAPTVLYLLGLPVARDMEGEVLSEAVRPEVLNQQATVFIDTYGLPAGFDDEDSTLNEETIKQLKALGYIQ